MGETGVRASARILSVDSRAWRRPAGLHDRSGMDAARLALAAGRRTLVRGLFLRRDGDVIGACETGRYTNAHRLARGHNDCDGAADVRNPGSDAQCPRRSETLPGGDYLAIQSDSHGFGIRFPGAVSCRHCTPGLWRQLRSGVYFYAIA